MFNKIQANRQSDIANKIESKLQDIYKVIQQACEKGSYNVEVVITDDWAKSVIRRIVFILSEQGFEVNYVTSDFYIKLKISWGM